MSSPCADCGALPAGIGGSAGKHRRDCVSLASLRDQLDHLAQQVTEHSRRLDDLEADHTPPATTTED